MFTPIEYLVEIVLYISLNNKQTQIIYYSDEESYWAVVILKAFEQFFPQYMFMDETLLERDI